MKPFCARCGWNLERAQIAAERGSAAWVGAASIAALGLFVAVAALAAMKSAPAVVIVPLVLCAIVFIPFWGALSGGKAIAAAKVSVNPALALTQPPLDLELQQLQAMPRPRRVRFRIPSSIVTVSFVAVLLAFGGLYVATHAAPNARRHSNPAGIIVVPIVFVVLLVVPYFRDKRKVPLMRDGELALGRVTYQENISAGKSSYSRIGYEFKTSSGQLIQDQAKDLSYSVFEDMTIPVFYEANNPGMNITPCATYLQVSTNPY